MMDAMLKRATKPRVLLIDDDHNFNNDMLRAFYKKYDFEIVVDFNEALNMENLQEYDLILVDIYDEGKKPRGKEIIKKIKNKVLFIPVIAISVKLSLKLSMETKQVGADHHFGKTEYDAEEWKAKFDELIKKKRSRESSVFLSHATRDKPFANRLARRLEEEGLDIWIDNRGIRPGDSISDIVFEQIRKSRFHIFILSNNAVNSIWVKKEIEAAKVNEEIKKINTIIPILYCKCKCPTDLSDKRRVDFSEIQAELSRLENYAFNILEENTLVVKDEIEKIFEKRFQELLKAFKAT